MALPRLVTLDQCFPTRGEFPTRGNGDLPRGGMETFSETKHFINLKEYISAVSITKLHDPVYAIHIYNSFCPIHQGIALSPNYIF